MTEPGITIIEGDDLTEFMAALGTTPVDQLVYRIRIWPQPDGQIKFKVNELTWTYLLGKPDQ